MTAKPGRMTTAVEVLLFSIFGVMLIAGAMALYSEFSPAYSSVPNTVDQGLHRDRLNVLLIGIGGDHHPGGGEDLADSIMLVSLKPSTRQVALTSIPRDYYIATSRYGAHRVNAAHDIGDNSGYPGRGPGLLSYEVSQITGQPIDGFVRVDFAAFERIIDDLGGIDVYVYRPFHDYLFNDGFDQGWQHLNGKRALAFARYRYVLGSEGTNFARELRQQQIVAAVKKKLQNLSGAQALRLLSDAGSVSRYTTTNLTTTQIARLYHSFHDIPMAKIRHVSLSPVTQVYVLDKLNDNGWAVRPADGTGAGVRNVVQNVFNGTGPIASPGEIQIAEGVSPRPAQVAGDDTLLAAQNNQPNHSRPAMRPKVE